ncbi:hypothetical protein GOP47_0028431 [Adiantum capillus-veneris]|nr:hypothetical protein GOP47_0028431 [Adiantum capillus-veneris]
MSRPKMDPWSTPFHQDFAISGLGHGLVFPQKNVFNYRFFKNKSKLEDVYTEKRTKDLPAFIRVLVGTKRALQEWLKSAGPGSCCLWTEIAEEDVDLCRPDAPNRLFKGQLHIAYRLRSATPLVLPVFPGKHLILSPQISQGEESLTIQEEPLGNLACGKWHSLRQKEKEKFLKSIGVNYMGDYFCVSSGQSRQGLLQSENWARRWLLGLPVVLYGQLTSMIAPGGSLWQFQQLVERIVHKPFFVEVEFELIDFKLWLEHHAYITILERSDFLVVLSTLQWTVVRFDFSEDDRIMITGDRCLNSLQQLWQAKKAMHQETDERQIGNGTLYPSGEMCFGCPQGRRWISWRSSDHKYGMTLLDVMYKEGSFSESKFADFFKQDFGFLVGVQEQEQNSPIGRSGVQELRSCHLTGSPLLSSKERCALSNLGSSSRTVRQRGIHILLDMLLGELKGNHNTSSAYLRSDSLNGRGISTPVSGSSVSYAINGSTSRSGELSSNESLRALSGSEKGENIKARDLNKKQWRINPNLQTDGMHSKGFPFHEQDSKTESLKMQSEGDVQRLPLSCDHMQSRENEGFEFSKLFEVFCRGTYTLGGKFGHNEVSCVEAVQMRLLEWVKGGFLEVLIEEAVCSPSKAFTGKEVLLSVDETADICLKTASALPADSTARIVNSMMIWLKDCNIDKDFLNCIFDNSGMKLQENWIDAASESYNKNNMIQTLTEELEKLWCSTKLLLLLIRGSTFIASGIARCGGLALIFEIYTFLVKLGILELNSPVPEIGRIRMVGTLPGGVLEHQRTCVKVPPFSTSFFNGIGHQRSVKPCTERSIPYVCDQNEELCPKERENCNVLARKVFEKVGRALLLILLCRGNRLLELFKSKFKSSKVLTSDTPDTSRNGSQHMNDSELRTIVLSPVEKLVSSNETRPKVPKLMLKPCLSEAKRKGCDKTNNFLWTTGTLSASSSVKSSSETLHNCCAMVLEAKVYLLEAYIALLLDSSAAAVLAQQELVSKLPTDIHTIVSVFMVDLFSCLRSFPQSEAKKLQDLIFEVMYRLDKLSIQNDPKASAFAMNDDSQRGGLAHEHDCSPVATDTSSMMINKAFLEEALESLRVMFTSSSGLPRDIIYAGPEKGDSSSLASETWQSITTLLCMLAECHTFFGKKGLPCLLKEDITEPLMGALSSFSGLGDPNSWSLCQILAMQSLLHLIRVIFQGLKDNKSYLSSVWMDYEEQIWQVIVNNKNHWACVKGYLSWLILESCHGCLKNLLNYWKFCSDVPEALALLLFSKPEFCLESPGFGCLRDAFEFLGSFVTLFHRRLCAQSVIVQDGASFFLPEDMALHLDFLMNPVDGLIMSTLKGPCCQGRMIHTEREIEVYTLDYCRMASEERIWPMRGSHELDVSPSCKLSSGKFSTTSMSDLGSSARILTEKKPSERLANQSRWGIKSWCWKTPNVFKIANGPTNGMDLDGIINQRSSSAESSDHSLSSRLERLQCLCETCASKLIAESLSLRISMLIEQKSLDLLAQVFGLKFIPDVHTKQLHEGKPADLFYNPFSSKRYVNAFLDFHFLSFLQLYNWKTDDQQKKTFKQNDVPKLVDCTYKVSEEESCANMDVFNSIQNASPKAIPSLLSDNDTITLACQKHGEVLLSLAQNQSGDISRRFKELRVMDFLLHQISLEYELSHVATPREPNGGPVSSNPPSTQTQHLGDSGVSKRKSDEKPMGGESPMLKRKKEEIAATCSTRSTEKSGQVVDVTTAGCVKMVGGRQRQRSRKISHDMPGIDPDSTRLLQSASLIQNNPNLQHHLLTCISILQRPVNQHGSFTCRAGADIVRHRFPLSAKDEFSPANVDKNHHPLSLRRQEFINFYFGIPAVAPHALKLNSINRKVINRHPPREIPIEKKSSLKCFDKSHKHCNCLDLNQYENSSFLFNDDSSESIEKMNHSKDSLVASFKVNSNLKQSNSKSLDTTQVSPDRSTGNSAFVYSGRFCDLNEEVEIELEREDAETHLELDTKCVLLSEDSENDALKSGKKILETSISCAKQKTHSKTGTSRPLVPKLNLPKSARKGDEVEKLLEEQEPVFSSTRRETRQAQQPKDCCEINKPVSGAEYSFGGNKVIGLSYERERRKRRIYQDCKLHVLLLELFISLMITPQGSLETCYTDRFPMDGQKMNAPFYLLYHINHADNSEARLLLKKRMRSFHPSVFRILKLLWRDLFDSSLYSNRKRIAHGAFAQIYTATVTQREGDVACKSVVLKTVDLPKGPHEPCKFFDIYSEVEILEKFIGDPRVCQLLDYGVDIESFILVLKHYKCSLRYWRQRQKLQHEISEDNASENLCQPFRDKLPLYLEIYSAVLQAVKVLESHNVVHYDIKCDNILLEPVENLHFEEEFWNPMWSKIVERSHLPFKVCIADFGQSKASILKGGECTVRNRGTECVKSPEMLKLLCTIKQDEAAPYVREMDESVGRAVDVWGLGCLLYELLTGEYLLHDEDWTRFFIRVTLPSEHLRVVQLCHHSGLCPVPSVLLRESAAPSALLREP